MITYLRSDSNNINRQETYGNRLFPDGQFVDCVTQEMINTTVILFMIIFSKNTKTAG